VELWKDASEGDKIIKKALSMLYQNNENLLHTILNPDSPRLRASSKKIKANSAMLSSGEELLIRIGLDAWDGSGGIHFNELYQKLDPMNFQRVIFLLNYLYSPNKKSFF
jgi:hypothetical protein